jgi:acylphosphatase
MSTVRRRVYYSGRVQGVGFRYTAERLAHEHPVAGYVRNMPDGRVELVAEGEVEAIGSLLTAIGRQMHGYIRDAHVVDEPPDDPPLAEFTIRH